MKDKEFMLIEGGPEGFKFEAVGVDNIVSGIFIILLCVGIWFLWCKLRKEKKKETKHIELNGKQGIAISRLPIIENEIKHIKDDLKDHKNHFEKIYDKLDEVSQTIAFQKGLSKARRTKK